MSLGSKTPVALATRLPLIVAELIVVVATWVRTFRHTKEASQLGANMSLSATLLRDGNELTQ